MCRTEEILSRTASLVSRTDPNLSRTALLLSGIDSVLSRTASFVHGVEQILSRTASLVSRTDLILSRTRLFVHGVEQMMSRTVSSLSRTRPRVSGAGGSCFENPWTLMSPSPKKSASPLYRCVRYGSLATSVGQRIETMCVMQRLPVATAICWITAGLLACDGGSQNSVHDETDGKHSTKGGTTDDEEEMERSAEPRRLRRAPPPRPPPSGPTVGEIPPAEAEHVEQTLEAARAYADKTPANMGSEIQCHFHPEKPPKDAWSNTFRVKCPDNSSITLLSAGPDGEFDTSDDVQWSKPLIITGCF